MSINETQRKYLRIRLDAIHSQKAKEINDAAVVPSPWTKTSKAEYVQKLLSENGLSLKLGKYGADYITTDLDTQHEAATNAAMTQAKTRRDSLKALYNKVMDDIILGDDADVLRTAIDSLSNFSPTGATN